MRITSSRRQRFNPIRRITRHRRTTLGQTTPRHGQVFSRTTSRRRWQPLRHEGAPQPSRSAPAAVAALVAVYAKLCAGRS